MRSVKPMQTAKIGYFIMSAVFCAVGILLILFPQMSAYTLCRMLGAILVLYGIIKMIGYFSKDLYRLAFQYDLAFGMLIMLIGLILAAVPGRVMPFLFIVFGILILTDGLFKIQIALDARRFGIRKWWLVFSLAVLSGVLGLLHAAYHGAVGNIAAVRRDFELLRRPSACENHPESASGCH